MIIIMTEIQEANKISCVLLHLYGFDGSLLYVQLQNQKKKQDMKVPHWLEQLEVFAAAAGSDVFCLVTRCKHFVSDDMV